MEFVIPPWNKLQQKSFKMGAYTVLKFRNYLGITFHILYLQLHKSPYMNPLLIRIFPQYILKIPC